MRIRSNARMVSMENSNNENMDIATQPETVDTNLSGFPSN